MEIFLIAILTFLIVILAGIFLFLAVNLFFSILTRNCPYIGTSRKTMEKILKEAELEEGQYFLELGCGDGRVLRLAAQKYKISGQGIDIHGWAILKAKILAQFQNLKNIEFKRSDIFEMDFGQQADIVYLFLTKEILEKLAPKLKNESRADTLIISHGFEVPGLKEYLSKIAEHDESLPSFQRRTFFYKFDPSHATLKFKLPK